jgi:hypothetical protein
MFSWLLTFSAVKNQLFTFRDPGIVRNSHPTHHHASAGPTAWRGPTAWSILPIRFFPMVFSCSPVIPNRCPSVPNQSQLSPNWGQWSPNLVKPATVSNSKYERRKTKYKVWDQPAVVRPLTFVLPTFVCTLYIVLRTFSEPWRGSTSGIVTLSAKMRWDVSGGFREVFGSLQGQTWMLNECLMNA